ncbi:hypothetical protein PG993_006321 [Apiospora rasikravindrae]|uniref:Uncharacterized protein n=1 Tax=Apiospora rasikravindrae TaxID=990691 RepID=A0ABR1T5D4_9PEZI
MPDTNQAATRKSFQFGELLNELKVESALKYRIEQLWKIGAIYEDDLGQETYEPRRRIGQLTSSQYPGANRSRTETNTRVVEERYLHIFIYTTTTTHKSRLELVLSHSSRFPIVIFSTPTSLAHAISTKHCAKSSPGRPSREPIGFRPGLREDLARARTGRRRPASRLDEDRTVLRNIAPDPIVWWQAKVDQRWFANTHACLAWANVVKGAMCVYLRTYQRFEMEVYDRDAAVVPNYGLNLLASRFEHLLHIDSTNALVLTASQNPEK